MNEMLIKLKKAVDRAMDTHGSTREVPLAEFPSHVLKSLEVILADPDEDRATRRLAQLKTSVDEACVIAKQSMGTGEDLETQRVHVVVYEEPAAAGTPAGTGSAEAGGNRPHEQELGQAIQSLQGEVAALKRALGHALGTAEDDRGQDAGAADEDARTAKAEERGGEPEEDEEDEDDEEKSKRKAKGKEGKRKAKGKEAASEQVAKAVAWPLDLNTRLSGAAPAPGASDDFDWGTDPDLEPAGR